MLWRYDDFSIFQDGGRRHLGFFKFQASNGRTAQEGRNVPQCEIWSKSVKPRRRLVIFRFFKIAAAVILDFQNFKLLTVGRLKRVEMHCRAKLGRNRSNRGGDMTIFRFFKMAAAAVLRF